MGNVVFIETPVFSRQIRALINDDEYAALQALRDSTLRTIIENW